MVLPALLTSVSSWAPAVWVNPTDFAVMEMNFSVCVAVRALAAAGSASPPAQPRMTAVPAAAMDVRIFMIAFLVC